MGSRKTQSKRKKGPVVIRGWSNDDVLKALEHVAESLGIQVRYERGDFQSAGCRVEDQRMIILETDDKVSSQINILMSELARFDTSHIDMPEALSQKLESLRKLL